MKRDENIHSSLGIILLLPSMHYLHNLKNCSNVIPNQNIPFRDRIDVCEQLDFHNHKSYKICLLMKSSNLLVDPIVENVWISKLTPYLQISIKMI